MGEAVTENRRKIQEDVDSNNRSAEAQSSPPKPQPQPPHRRPRVREVSSRFMSPVVTSSSSGDLHLVATRTPVQTRQPQQQQRSNSARRHQELEPFRSSSADESRPAVVRSLDTPLELGLSYSKGGELLLSQKRKHRAPAAAAAKFSNKENHNHHEDDADPSLRCSKQLPSGRTHSSSSSSSRLDTPIPHPPPPSLDRVVGKSRSYAITAAAKLLHSSGMSLSSSFSSSSSRPNTVPSKVDVASLSSVDRVEIETPSCRTTTPAVSDFRFTNGQPTTTERNSGRSSKAILICGHVSKVSASPCSRSVNSTPLTSERLKPSGMPSTSLPRTSSNFMKLGGVCLPPLPSFPKPVTDSRKSGKVSTHQEDVHFLRLLQNQYLQWRIANAKAKSCAHSLEREAQKALYAIGLKISALCDSVRLKRLQLDLFQRGKKLSTVFEAQMPYLDEWSALEGEYSSSLSQLVQALSNASLQLPLSGNLTVEMKGVNEVLSSAMDILESTFLYVQSYMAKAEEIENLVSELALTIGGEGAYVEECGDLLSCSYFSQVEECTLRAQLIQYQRSSHQSSEE